MLRIENVQTCGWETAIRGMRNPMNSWDKSDSYHFRLEDDQSGFVLGDNDLKLTKSLSMAGSDHAKYKRMIHVSLDITAPLYWWKEFDTYKVGTVANSCSTMHKIASKEFEVDDFSFEHVLNPPTDVDEDTGEVCVRNLWRDKTMREILDGLNVARNFYLSEKDPDKKKHYWWQMIQLLPSSYNQRRTVDLNYQVLTNMYFARRDHKLDEWHVFCDWIRTLPYADEMILSSDKS